MFGSFSEEALAEYSEMVSQTQSADFSEGDTYDFTRCMRPNGSIYGTRGQCRKGVESTKAAAAKVAERAGKLARQRKNQTPEKKELYDKMAKNAAARAREPFQGGNPRENMTPAERDRRRDAAVYHGGLHGGKKGTYGPGEVTKDTKKKRKQKFSVNSPRLDYHQELTTPSKGLWSTRNYRNTLTKTPPTMILQPRYQKEF